MPAAKSIRAVVMGSAGVGKSALSIRYVQSVFTEDYDPTIEDSYHKQLTYKPSSASPPISVSMEIIDTAGTDQFEAMRDLYLKTGSAFVIVFSVQDRVSLREAEDIMHQIKRVRGQPMVPMVLVGNKADLKNREIERQEGLLLARSWSAPYVETSARTGDGVEAVFETVLGAVMSRCGAAEGASKRMCCCLQ